MRVCSFTVCKPSWILAGCLIALASGGAVAEEPRLLFEDDFATLDPTLGEADDTLGVRDNTLFRVLDADYWWRTFYEALVFDNFDATIDVRLADFAAGRDDAIGLAFWGVDLHDFYALQISASGTFAILRRNGDQWLVAAPWRTTDAIKTGAGDWNELRVVASGGRATAFINGQQVASIKGRPPAGGSLLGVYFQSTADGAVGEFAKLRVAAAPAPPASEPADPNVLLADDFSELDPALGVPDDALYVRDNVLSSTLDAEYYWRGFYQSERFASADATVRVRMPSFAAEQGNKIGLAFWAADAEDYYLLEISDSGTFAVYHAAPQQWFAVSPWRDTDAIKRDPGAWNDLRVVTSGGRATLYINGQQVATVKGRPPAGGGMIGLFGEAMADDTRFEFASLRVLQGPEPPPGDLSTDPNVLVFDDFSSFDPSWGTEQGWFSVADGRMFIDFEPGQAFTALCRAATFEDLDATVNVRTVGNAPDDGAASGMAFWTDGGEDYYLVVLFRTGSIMVTRRLGGEWKQPLPARDLPADAKFDPAAPTKLRLTTAGSKATVYVNDVEIATVSGQPPSEGFMFGLWGQAGSKESRSEFSDLVIRKP